MTKKFDFENFYCFKSHGVQRHHLSIPWLRISLAHSLWLRRGCDPCSFRRINGCSRDIFPAIVDSAELSQSGLMTWAPAELLVPGHNYAEKPVWCCRSSQSYHQCVFVDQHSQQMLMVCRPAVGMESFFISWTRRISKLEMMFLWDQFPLRWGDIRRFWHRRSSSKLSTTTSLDMASPLQCSECEKVFLVISPHRFVC